jgi:hypothetical protein
MALVPLPTCVAALLVFTAGALAQHGSPSTPTSPPPAKSPPATTHAPKPELHPLRAWQHVQAGNAAAAAAIAARRPVPAPPPRPAGAGRYVCAVLVCADTDADVPALLGLARRDVLLLSVPGPFASPDVAAALERAVAAERLSLVVVLGHPACPLVANPPASADALTRRLDAMRAEAQRRGEPLPRTQAVLQTEQLLAASERLRGGHDAGTLRILPAELDGKSGQLTWHHQRADAMPLAPVK